MTMPIFDAAVPGNGPADEAVTLPFEARQKARQRVVLDCGGTAGLKLPRGTVLRGGDRLASGCGRTLVVNAAPEPLSQAATTDPLLLARAAYHLGNRHVWVEVGDGRLRYLHDHVLDAMLRALGLAVSAVTAPFEPEGGAYSGHGASAAAGSDHAHGHAAHHDHKHGHDHEDGHDHDHDHGDHGHHRGHGH